MQVTSRKAGQRARVPKVSAIPSRIDATGLVYTAKNENGTKSEVFDFTTFPGSVLLRQQAANSLASLNGPNGKWKSIATCYNGYWAFRRFAAWSDTVHLGNLDDLTPDLWGNWLAHTRGWAGVKARNRNTLISHVRSLVLSHPTVTQSARQAVLRRYSETPEPTTGDFYTVEEYQALRRAARVTLRAADQRITPNWELVQTPRRDVAEADRDRWDALNHILDGGFPITQTQWLALGAVADNSEKKSRRRKSIALKSLFLDSAETLAAATALLCETGENVGTMEARGVPSTAATAGDADVTVMQSTLSKPRRGSGRHHIAENAGGGGERGDVLGRIARVTGPARECARRQGLPSADLLFIHVIQPFALRSGLVDWTYAMRNRLTWMPDGVRLNFAKLHRTVLTRVRARATNNTESTFAQSYLAQDPDKQAEWGAVAARGIDNLFKVAHETVHALLTHEEAEKAGLLSTGPQNYLTPTGIGCKDCTANPRTGAPCDDPWLACFGCANAFAVDDHLPLLVGVLDMLETLREASTEELWESRYMVAWARLTVILSGLTEAQWSKARADRTDEEMALVRGAILTREYEI